MTVFSLVPFQSFFKKLKGAAALCASAANYLAKGTSLSEKGREHRIADIKKGLNGLANNSISSLAMSNQMISKNH
jgi:hypothetical protein